ncbi:hypothetical protein DFJ73DRAFT_473950 [Zopfochytrium polystomum]|nr:hypothetical protein DFJ73DRAFT_473950 [Zopfochytrium polystomum]
MNVPNSESFVHAYTRACESRQTSFQSHLLSPALQTLKHLLVDSDRIKREEDWDPLIKGIKANRDLQRISIISDIGQTDPEVKVESKASTSKLIQSGSRSVNHQSPARVRALRLPAVALLSRISCFLASALRDCLQGSYALTVLELSGINLSEKEMKMISVGLFGSKSLRELSLARSHIGDEGLRVISRGIKLARGIHCGRITQEPSCTTPSSTVGDNTS